MFSYVRREATAKGITVHAEEAEGALVSVLHAPRDLMTCLRSQTNAFVQPARDQQVYRRENAVSIDTFQAARK